MGTRGAYGFHKDGIDKITYNHYDSYPSALGDLIKKFVVTHIDQLNSIFDNIELVDDSIEPTSEQVESCSAFTDVVVGDKSTSDWYCLIRHAQGDLGVYADGLKYMVGNADFLKNSLFCEWGYVINLTTGRLEIYRGFQHKPQENRYKVNERQDNLGGHISGGYFNCALIREIPLSQVRNFDMSAFEREICEQEEVEE